MLESLGSSLEFLGSLWDFLQQEAGHGSQEASNFSHKEVLVLGSGMIQI